MGFGVVYPLIAEVFAGTQGSHLAKHLSLTLRHFYLGLGFLLYPLCMFFGASFMGDLSDIWERKKVLLLCMGGMAIAFLLMGIGVTFFSIFVLLLGRAQTGFLADSQPIAQAVISDLSTPENKARNLGVITLVLGIGTIFGPAMAVFF